MADEQRTAEYELRYTVNQSSLNSAIQGTNRLSQTIDANTAALGKLGVAADNSVSRLRQRIEGAQGTVRQFGESIEDLRGKLESLNDVDIEPDFPDIPSGPTARPQGQRQSIAENADRIGSVGSQILSAR
jgi:hypothetical protein